MRVKNKKCKYADLRMTKTQIENRQIDRENTKKKKGLSKRNEKLLEGCKRKTGKENNSYR